MTDVTVPSQLPELLWQPLQRLLEADGVFIAPRSSGAEQLLPCLAFCLIPFLPSNSQVLLLCASAPAARRLLTAVRRLPWPRRVVPALGQTVSKSGSISSAWNDSQVVVCWPECLQSQLSRSSQASLPRTVGLLAVEEADAVFRAPGGREAVHSLLQLEPMPRIAAWLSCAPSEGRHLQSLSEALLAEQVVLAPSPLPGFEVCITERMLLSNWEPLGEKLRRDADASLERLATSLQGHGTASVAVPSLDNSSWHDRLRSGARRSKASTARMVMQLCHVASKVLFSSSSGMPQDVAHDLGQTAEWLKQEGTLEAAETALGTTAAPLLSAIRESLDVAALGLQLGPQGMSATGCIKFAPPGLLWELQSVISSVESLNSEVERALVLCACAEEAEIWRDAIYAAWPKATALTVQEHRTEENCNERQGNASSEIRQAMNRNQLLASSKQGRGFAETSAVWVKEGGVLFWPSQLEDQLLQHGAFADVLFVADPSASARRWWHRFGNQVRDCRVIRDVSHPQSGAAEAAYQECLELASKWSGTSCERQRFRPPPLVLKSAPEGTSSCRRGRKGKRARSPPAPKSSAQSSCLDAWLRQGSFVDGRGAMRASEQNLAVVVQSQSDSDDLAAEPEMSLERSRVTNGKSAAGPIDCRDEPPLPLSTEIEPTGRLRMQQGSEHDTDQQRCQKERMQGEPLQHEQQQVQQEEQPEEQSQHERSVEHEHGQEHDDQLMKQHKRQQYADLPTQPQHDHRPRQQATSSQHVEAATSSLLTRFRAAGSGGRSAAFWWHGLARPMQRD